MQGIYDNISSMKNMLPQNLEKKSTKCMTLTSRCTIQITCPNISRSEVKHQIFYFEATLIRLGIVKDIRSCVLRTFLDRSSIS